MRITTTVEASGGTTTGLPVPEDVALSFGRGRKVPVRVTIGDPETRQRRIEKAVAALA